MARDKQRVAHAASFLRIAKDHRVHARNHRAAAKKPAPYHERLMHRALAVFHDETAGINKAEATFLRDMT